MTITGKILNHYFTTLFGVPPVVCKQEDTYLQITFNFKNISKKKFYQGLKHLKTLKNQNLFCKIIFDGVGGFHIFVIEPEAIEKLKYLNKQGDDIVLEFKLN